MRPDELASVLSALQRAPGNHPFHVGRQTDVIRSAVGTGEVSCLEYVGRCPGVHTFFVHSVMDDSLGVPEGTGDPARAGLVSLIRARLVFGVGGVSQEVEFDCRNAVLSVPCDNAYLTARFVTSTATDWNGFRVFAHAAPGAWGSGRTPLLWTSESFDVSAGGSSTPVIIPRYAYGVKVAGPNPMYVAQNTRIMFRGGTATGTGIAQPFLRLDLNANDTAGAATSVTREFIECNGAAHSVQIEDLVGDGPFDDVRFVFALRL